jgi:hypothetical protein
VLSMRSTAVWRLLFEASLPQRQRCLCSYFASPRSGFAQVQRHCFLSWAIICDLWATTFEFYFSPELIRSRNGTRSRVAASARSPYTSATALSLPLFRFTWIRVCAGAA